MLSGFYLEFGEKAIGPNLKGSKSFGVDKKKLSIFLCIKTIQGENQIMHTWHNCIKVLEGSLLTVVFIIENLDLVSIYLFFLPYFLFLVFLYFSSIFPPLCMRKFYRSHQTEHSELSHWWLAQSSAFISPCRL